MCVRVCFASVDRCVLVCVGIGESVGRYVYW